MKSCFRVFLGLVILLGILHNFTLAANTQLAPDFKLKSLKNDTVTLSGFRNDKPVLLLFWTTWCPYCRDQLMWIKDKYPEFSKQGLELLTINIGESAEKIEKFVKLRDLSFPFLLDQDSSVAASFGIMGVPTYALIDKKGYIVLMDNSFPARELKDILSQ